jgi:hypothetical protein
MQELDHISLIHRKISTPEPMCSTVLQLNVKT